MKKACIASLLGISLLLPSLAAATVPSTIAFSARVADNGQPVAGTATFVLDLFNDPTAGTSVWTETHTNVTVTNGVVSLTLGDTTTTPPGTALPTFDGTPLWLQVKMTYNGTTTTFAPRMAIQTVPYAFHASLADSVPWSGIAGKPGGLACNTYSNNTSIAAGANGGVTVQCGSGSMVSGGFQWSFFGGTITACNSPYFNGWYACGTNTAGSANTLTVFTVCCYLP